MASITGIFIFTQHNPTTNGYTPMFISGKVPEIMSAFELNQEFIY